MSIARSVAEVLREHVELEVEAIDRMYLNVYVPHLQSVGAVVGYPRVHRSQRFAPTTAVTPMTEAFVRNIDQFVNDEGVDLVTFQKGQRKDDVTQKYLRRFRGREGVLYVGKAQEKARVMRTERRSSRFAGGTYPWIVESTAMVNHYYFYCVDEDFGPFFVKFCSYFPYNAKLCINGHEYLKRQLAKRAVAFEPLDNGVKSCADPKLMQRLCDALSADKIDRLLRKWLRRLPHPFPPRDRAAGYRYLLSILQAEFSLTQRLDQPVTGRIFFEEVIRENLDIGRPSQVSLVFDRKVSRRTPGRFRTRIITDGVVPSLHVDYKKTRIKQYHKEGQALRTETTINDTHDFAIGRRIENLDELRKIGFAANRRLLDDQRIGHDCFIGEASFHYMQRPVTLNHQRAAGLRFADPRVEALLHILLLFLLVQSLPPRRRGAHSPTRICASILLHCWGKSSANRPREASPTTCVGCASTALPSASQKPTATASPPRDCAQPSSTPASITARCGPVSPSSLRAQPIANCQWPSPSGPQKPLSTNGTNIKNSQHENLTQLFHKEFRVFAESSGRFLGLDV
jgi:hypothetical protein